MEDGYVSSFVQGDDGAILAGINQRSATCTPMLRCELQAARCECTLPGLIASACRTEPVKALQLSLVDPPYQTKTASVKACRWSRPLTLLAASPDKRLMP